jgi:hypothetical protein
VPPEWWKYKEPKRVSELAGYLISGTDQGEAILGDLVRIHPMASERVETPSLIRHRSRATRPAQGLRFAFLPRREAAGARSLGRKAE